MFLPVIIWFFIEAWPLMSTADKVLGLILGLLLNVVGVIGLIRVMENPTAPQFEARQVEPAIRFQRS